MTMQEFIEKAKETYFENSYKVVEAIKVTKEKFNITDEKMKEWFGQDISQELLEN